MADKHKNKLETISQLVKFFLPNDQDNNDNNKDNKKEQTFKKIFIEWASKSSAHGFPGLSNKNSNYVIRIVWIILMLTSWSYCFYTIIKTLRNYFEFGCDSKIDYINQTPFPFPAIDICNLSPFGYNLFNQQVIDILVNDIEYADNMSNQTIEQEIIEKYYGIIGDRSPLEKHHEVVGNDLRFYEFFYQQNKQLFDTIPHNLSSILFNCVFKNKKCSTNDFKRYRNFFYGSCYRFNWDINNLKTISKPGLKHGFKLELFTGLDTLDTSSDGFKILINNQSFEGYPEENGIDISPGFQTNIAISRTFIKNLDWPYNECLDNLINNKYSYLIKKSEILQKMKSNGIIDYDQNLCFKLCLQKYVTESCGCYDLSGPQYYYEEYKGCYYSKDKYCSLYSDIMFYQTNAADNCIKACPDRCTKFVYDTKVSFSKYPSKWYAKNYLLNNQTVIDDYLNHVALVNIYFNEMPFKMVQQKETIDLESLLGYIGGQLG
jgi:hypothetical protein